MMKNYLLPAISVILLTLIITGIPGKYSFKLTAPDLVERISHHDHIITPEKLRAIESQDEDLVLVDLRTRGEFLEDHLPGAINFPADEMNLKSLQNLLAGSSASVLFSGGSPSAVQVWILSAQMGIENVFVLDTSTITIPGDELPTFELNETVLP